MSLLFFAFLALVALIGALGVVLSRNAVHSALFLLLNFATVAVLYFTLNAQFLGVVQVIVYAGAIVVLFLFVIMLIGNDIGPVISRSRPYARLVAILLAALLLSGLIYATVQTLPLGTAPQGIADAGSVQTVGELLYTTYLLPFELASVLLLVGMLGAVVLARRYTTPPEE